LCNSQLFSWPQRFFLGKGVIDSFSYDGELWSWGE
jgi:hypothetical protein